MADQVGMAVVGYGYWGVNLARNVVVGSGSRLVGIADSHPDRQALAAENHPGINVWSSLDDVLRDETVDAVVLSVPAGLHGPLATRVIKSGRHILVEKPLAMSGDEGQRLIDLAAEHDRVLMVGHTFLYSAAVQRLRDVIVDGTLGAVQYLSSQRLSLGRIRRDCNALWNFGPHDVSIMLYLLDEQPCEVSARGFSFIGEGIEDVVFASLVFPSGIGANIHMSWIDPRKARLVTVVGDEKMAIYDDVSVDKKLSIVDAGVAGNRQFGSYESLGDFQWRTRAGDILIPHIEMREPLRVEIEEFAECCRTGRTPRTDGTHGLQVVRVLEAIDASIRLRGGPVEIAW